MPGTRSTVVIKHYGFLSFDSEVGKGTTFTIRPPTDGVRAASNTVVSEGKEADSGG